MARSGQKGPCDRVLKYVLAKLFLEVGAYKVKTDTQQLYGEYRIGTFVRSQYAPYFDWNEDGEVNDLDIVCPIRKITAAPPPKPSPFIGSLDPRTYTTENSEIVPGVRWGAPLYVPAGCFSGKLRLYVQSIYGAKRKDIRAESTLATGSWVDLEVDKVEIPYRNNDSSWLVTTEEFEYYLCSLATADLNQSSVDIRVRKMIPIDGAKSRVEGYKQFLREEFAGKANNHSDTECTITEAVLFAMLKPSAEEYQLVSVPVPANGGIIFGSPIEYGWHSSWDGREAKQVNITIDTISFGAASHELTITTSISKVDDGEGNLIDDLSFVMTSTSPQEMQVQNDAYVWIPEGYPYNRSWLPTAFYMCGIRSTPGPIITDPPEEWANFPVYGWYDKENGWLQCQLSRENLGNDGLAEAWGQFRFCATGSASQEVTKPGTEILRHTVKIGGVVTSAGETVTSGGEAVTSGIEKVETYSAVSLYLGASEASVFNGNIITEIKQSIYLRNRQAECPPEEQDTIFINGLWTHDTGVRDYVFGFANEYGLTGRPVIFLLHGECSGVIFGNRDYASSTSGTVEEGTGFRWNADYTLQMMQCENEVNGTLLFSGSEYQFSRTDDRGRWEYVLGSEYTVISEQYPVGDSDRIILKAIYDGQIIELHNQTMGTNPGQPSALHGEIFNRFPYLTPGAGANPSFNQSLVGLFEAPAGICLTGEREINTTGYLIHSAHFKDLIGKDTGILEGVLEPFTTPEYEDADTFCGWN